ncbi:hypothetical protein XPA_006281 [Xanthoria parietina]
MIQKSIILCLSGGYTISCSIELRTTRFGLLKSPMLYSRVDTPRVYRFLLGHLLRRYQASHWDEIKFPRFNSHITNIDKIVLDGEEPLRFEKWKQNVLGLSKTDQRSRISYLLSNWLFVVSMPLICREKHKAFFRLQTAIMKVYEDHFVFA